MGATATAAARPVRSLAALTLRFSGEFREMPGLRLTAPQAARLFGVEADVAVAVLDELRRASVLAMSTDGRYGLISSEGMDLMSAHLKHASIDRLTCLLRHWTWADEALGRLEREMADGWMSEDEPLADHPFGAYYHWCALLCAFGEAALEQGLLSPSELDAIRDDLEATLPGMKSCRDLLVVIPSSLAEQPRAVDLVRDDAALNRLRRIHATVGNALRAERMAREVESLDQ